MLGIAKPVQADTVLRLTSQHSIAQTKSIMTNTVSLFCLTFIFLFELELQIRFSLEQKMVINPPVAIKNVLAPSFSTPQVSQMGAPQS